jgi:hypothetical protein
MRVLGYFIWCCAAVLLLSVIIEKRNAEVEIPHVVETPHVPDEVRPRVSGGPSKDVKQTVEIRLMRPQDWVELCARNNPYRQGFTKEMVEECDKREKSRSGQ